MDGTYSLGLNLSFKEQSKPVGLPDAFLIGEKFINNSNVALILGDNFFYGQNLSGLLSNCVKLKQGAKIVLHSVKNPEMFGVAKINPKNKKILKISEKPKKFISNYAITGLYFFDKKVIEYAKKLKPSKRGELEIIDLIEQYKKKRKLSAEFIGRGGAWLDTGSVEDYYKTSAFVSAIENRQGLKIACLEEIGLSKGWLLLEEVAKATQAMGKNGYGEYLGEIVAENG